MILQPAFCGFESCVSVYCLVLSINFRLNYSDPDCLFSSDISNSANGHIPMYYKMSIPKDIREWHRFLPLDMG